MKTISGLFVVLLSLALLAAILYGGYYVVQTVWVYLAMLELETRILLLSGIAGVLLSSLIVAAAIKSSAKTAAVSAVTTEKLALYKKLIEISFGATNAIEQLKKLKPDVVLLASSTVVEVYEKIVATTPGDAATKSGLEGLYSQLVKSIRQDLGHKTAVGIPRSWHVTSVKDDIELDAGRSL